MKFIGGHVVVTKPEARERILKEYERISESDADVVALVNLAGCHNVLEEDDVAMFYSRKAVESLPWVQSVTALNYAQILRQYGAHEEAWPWISMSHKLYPTQMNGHIYAEELVRRGRWLEAWPIFSKCRFSKDKIAPKDVPEWMGQDITGKQLMVISEGGRGDAFWLFRFLPRLRDMGIHVNFAVWQDVWDFIKDHPWLKDPAKSVFTEARMPDCWVSIFELLQWFKVEEPYWPGPYLEANNTKALQMQFKLGPSTKPRVGLCWECGEKDDVRKFRSLKLSQAEKLTANTSVEWISLQKGFDPPVNCREMNIGDWHDTAAIIDNLDLVISMDTSVIHLAGAMGKPAWVLLGGYQDCKWGTGDYSGWYPNTRIFRNDTVGFDHVLEQVNFELEKFVLDRDKVLVANSPL